MRDFRLRSLNRNFYSDFPGVSLYLHCTVFIVFINEKPDEFRNFSENSIRSRLIFILQANLSQYYIRSLHVEHLNEILFSPFGKLCNRIEIKLHAITIEIFLKLRSLGLIFKNITDIHLLLLLLLSSWSSSYYIFIFS